jgi:hemolysin III
VARFFQSLREPINALTHGAGFLMASIFTLILAWKTGLHWAFLVFGSSMMLVYLASALHHGVKGSPKLEEGLRRFDHAAIYVLIAGTYTPIVWTGLEQPWRDIVLIAIWGLSLCGVLIKSLTLPPEWLSVTFYVLMGWFGVVLLPQFLSRFPITAIIAMVIGGLMYTFGVPFYASRKPKKGLIGAHEIWHGFVIAGSISHFVMMMNLRVS